MKRGNKWGFKFWSSGLKGIVKQTLSLGPLHPGKSLFYQRTDEYFFFTISSYVTSNEYTNNHFIFFELVDGPYHLHLSRVNCFRLNCTKRSTGIVACVAWRFCREHYVARVFGYRYRRVQGSNPGKPEFFKAFFINCISYVFNCDDLLSIYIFNLYGYVVFFF